MKESNTNFRLINAARQAKSKLMNDEVSHAHINLIMADFDEKFHIEESSVVTLKAKINK